MLLNKYIPRITALCLALALIATLSVFAIRRNEQSFIVPDSSVLENNSNRHLAPESGKRVENLLYTDGYELKMSNDVLEVWYRKEVKGIRIRDKRSGYIWGSVSEDKVEGLNKKWNQTAHSICTIEYLDSKYNVTKVSMSDSSVKVKENWKKDSATFKLDLKRQDISLEFTLKLKDDSINITLNDKEISEEDEFLLKDVYFMPFLGCVLEDTVDGYIFIPDGSGALMRFNKSSKYIGGYSQKIYGPDMGIDRLTEVNDLVSTRTNDYLVDSSQITVPVYGVVHGAGQNAVMTVIENGEEFCHIEADPAGVVTPYNRVKANFNYRQMYTHTVGKNGGGVYRPQKDKNLINPSVTFTFLTGSDADYTGMALKYRDALIKDGKLSKERKDNQIPLALNVIGAEISEGSLFNYTKKFTTVNEAKDMISRLSNDGIGNITMLYEGWQKGGINGADYGKTAFQSSVGSKSDFESLKSLLSKNGGRLYLNTNITTANEDQVNPQSEAALQASKQYAVFTRANSSVMYNKYYALKPKLIFETIDKMNSKLSGFDFALGNLGYRMYSDYTSTSPSVRGQFSENLIKALEKADMKTAFSSPNAYLYKYTSEYFDIPMNNSQYLYETDTVPFLQIMIKGSIDYYTPYANQSGYSRNDILKMIEFGAYPSFVVASCDNYELQDTPLEDYFSLSFDDWYGTIKELYKEVNKALTPVEGAKISDHTVIKTGVVKVLYDNGVSIYVNYTSEDYADGNVTVSPFSYEVLKGGEVK